MIKPKFFGKIQNAQLRLHDVKKFREHIAHYKDGSEMEITVARKYKRRTSGQSDEETNFNGYYWSVIVGMVSDTIGEADRQAVHDWIQMAIGNVKRMPDGREVAGSTKDMSGGEFADMCARARMWANQPGAVCEMGLFLPEPNEAEY